MSVVLLVAPVIVTALVPSPMVKLPPIVPSAAGSVYVGPPAPDGAMVNP